MRQKSLRLCSFFILPSCVSFTLPLSAATTINQYGIATDSPYVVNRFMHEENGLIRLSSEDVLLLFIGRGQPNPEPKIAAGTNTLPNVPAFNWSYGCSATAAAMMFGYCDNMGYPDVYTGPTNDGVMPMDNAVWGSGECPLSTTHLGIDGRNRYGAMDDYWIAPGSTADDPFITNSWIEHTRGVHR